MKPPTEPAHPPADLPVSPPLQLPFTLSAAQRRAAAEVAAALHAGVRQVVIWAACGAGKTEVLYEAMQGALVRRQTVLLTTPRRDICAELHERLARVFSPTAVIGLYGGAAERYRTAPIIVATTHQCLRLAGSYGLVVLDECDAFPYTADETLREAVARLAGKSGCFVQMTATPLPALRRPAASARLIYIPARYHGYPLPIPVVRCDRTLSRFAHALARQEAAPAPQCLEEVMATSLREPAQLLVFVPRRRYVSPLVTVLQRCGARVAGVHSQTGNRDEVRQAFARGELEVVVATTVFERGLTFPRADVAVLFADAEEIFSQAALVQMAGRVGRTAARPSGRVWYLASRVTGAMRQAVADIAELNAVAARCGLLQTTLTSPPPTVP